MLTDDNITKTSQFLLPIVDQPYKRLISSGFVNAYLGHADEEENFGTRIYLVFKKEFDDKVKQISMINTLKLHEFYYQVLEGEKEKIVVLELPEDYRVKVVAPFLKGKYSKIDRKYVEENFAPIVRVGNQIVHDVTYAVLVKDRALKEYWEDLLDVELPEDAEVWSIPEKELETYHPK